MFIESHVYTSLQHVTTEQRDRCKTLLLHFRMPPIIQMQLHFDLLAKKYIFSASIDIISDKNTLMFFKLGFYFNIQFSFWKILQNEKIIITNQYWGFLKASTCSLVVSNKKDKINADGLKLSDKKDYNVSIDVFLWGLPIIKMDETSWFDNEMLIIVNGLS